METRSVLSTHCRSAAVLDLLAGRPAQGVGPGAGWKRGFAAALVSAGLAACGGGGTPAEQPQAARPEALSASKPGELLAFVKTTLDKRWALGMGTSGRMVWINDWVYTMGGAPAGAPSAPAPESFASTTLQEAGVDEDDLLKTDGQTLFSLLTQESTETVAGPVLLVHHRLDDGRLKLASRWAFEAPDSKWPSFGHGLHLDPQSHRVALLAQSWRGASGTELCAVGSVCSGGSLLPYRPSEVREQVHVEVLDAADPSALQALSRISIDGNLIGSRRVGSALVLVTQWSPRLTVDALPLTATDGERSALLDRLTVAELLPTVRTNGGAAAPLLADTDCWVQPVNASLDLQITTITTIDLASLARQSRCFVGGSEAVYMSQAGLYVATTRYETTAQSGFVSWPAGASTDIHKFRLGEQGVQYRGSGSVAGHLGWDNEKKAYRLSEFKGDLRVVTFTGEAGWVGMLATEGVPEGAPSPATLSVLRQGADESTLDLLATLPNQRRPEPLGKAGEQVYAVRFIGDKGYVVTFRQVDPLYVLDLSDAADPKTVGELMVPGFSDYLFPIGDGLLLGVGKDASDDGLLGGVKLALFDVTDPRRPRELATRALGGPGSYSGLDMSRHGINLFTQGDFTRVALPLSISEDGGATSRQGLQRFEVDAQARTLVTRPMVGEVFFDEGAWPESLRAQRSVQIGGQVYYLAGGGLTGWDW